MTTITVGHSLALTISYLDANGNPMLTTPVPDAPPAWTQTTPATETLTVAADGNSASTVALVAGTDVVSLSLAVGGTAFSATLAVEVDAAPQVLTSIAITAVAS